MSSNQKKTFFEVFQICSNCCQTVMKALIETPERKHKDLAFASTNYTAMELHKWARRMCEYVTATLTLKHCLFAFE